MSRYLIPFTAAFLLFHVQDIRVQENANDAAARFATLRARERSFITGLAEATRDPNISDADVIKRSLTKWAEFGEARIEIAKRYPHDSSTVLALITHFDGSLAWMPTANEAAEIIVEQYSNSKELADQAEKFIPLLRARHAPVLCGRVAFVTLRRFVVNL